MDNTLESSEFREKTRNTFHDIHLIQGADNDMFDRLVTLLSTDYLGVDKDFFKGKTCLDAGCGSNGNATYAMLQMGAEKVVAFDLTDNFIEPTKKKLAGFEGKYELRVENVLSTSLEDNSFDFIHSSGVLHHTGKPVVESLKELNRLLKPGGTLYFMVYGSGGIITEFTTLLREKYSQDETFKTFIDTLDENKLNTQINFVLETMKQNKDPLGNIPSALVKKLFDTDLILTIKDRMQSPVYTETSEKELRDWLEANGFEDIQRLKRYPHYNNIRRFLSPLYCDYTNELSQVLYGDGMVQLKATKKP